MTKNKGILIKNIYYMLSYAFQTINRSVYDDFEKEEFDNIYNLFAAILAKGISFQLKQGLYKEYVNFRKEQLLVRGKIHMSDTIRNKIAHKKSLTCEFDELSENNLLNQIIKTTVMMLLKNTDVDEIYKNELKKEMLFFSKVGTLELINIKWGDIKFQHGNQTYRLLIEICRLTAEGMLLTTEHGKYRMSSFVDEQSMNRLYEKFILEYYDRHFPDISVSAAHIPWALDDGMNVMLPIMKSDVLLQKGNRALIIDAKYYKNMTQKNYDNHTIHSHNLYQIFTYVKNFDYSFGAEEHSVSGMLLYAKAENEIQPDVEYHMHGNRISVQTLDLNREFPELARQLNNIAVQYFDTNAVQ